MCYIPFIVNHHYHCIILNILTKINMWFLIGEIRDYVGDIGGGGRVDIVSNICLCLELGGCV